MGAAAGGGIEEAMEVASDEPLSNRERVVGMRYCCTTCIEPCTTTTGDVLGIILVAAEEVGAVAS